MNEHKFSVSNIQQKNIPAKKKCSNVNPPSNRIANQKTMKNSCKYLEHLPHTRYYIINSFNPQNIPTGTSLGVQWLRLQASTAGGMGSFPC